MLAVDVRQLLVDRHHLAVLPEIAERLRQQVERLDVVGVALEAELQLRQRALGVAAREVEVGELAGDGEIARLDRRDPLGHLQVLVGAPLPFQQGPGPAEALQRGRDLATARVELAELDGGGDVVRVELDHLPEHGGQPDQVAGPLATGRHLLQLAHGVAHEPELLVEPREPLVHLEVGRIQADDLLVDGDRLEEEALVGVGLRDPREGVGRGPRLALALVELADLEQDADVLRVRGQHLPVGRDRLVERALLDEPGGLRDDLVLVDGHLAGRRSRAGSRRRRSRGPRAPAPTRAGGSPRA